MATKILTICFLLAMSSCYIIEVEVPGRKKQCISEVLKKDEPISIRGTMIKANREEFSVYLTIETMKNKLMTHKKYETKSPSTVLSYNNVMDMELNLCVDNFEAYLVIIELDIKFGAELGSTDLAPTKNVTPGFAD